MKEGRKEGKEGANDICQVELTDTLNVKSETKKKVPYLRCQRFTPSLWRVSWPRTLTGARTSPQVVIHPSLGEQNSLRCAIRHYPPTK